MFRSEYSEMVTFKQDRVAHSWQSLHGSRLVRQRTANIQIGRHSNKRNGLSGEKHCNDTTLLSGIANFEQDTLAHNSELSVGRRTVGIQVELISNVRDLHLGWMSTIYEGVSVCNICDVRCLGNLPYWPSLSLFVDLRKTHAMCK